MWDESRYAVNAFELIKTKNFIVQFYNGVPDMWNTKPPLATWLMAAFMKLIGYNELAVRLTSALSATIAAIAVYHFTEKHTRNSGAGFFSGMVFITAIGFVGSHVARTGEADALAVMFLTLFVFSFYGLMMNPKKDQPVASRKFYYPAVFFSLALMTKSAYGLFILPGLFISILVFKRQELFKNKHLYFAFFVSLLPYVIYTIVREYENPGYLHAVLGNDLFTRYLQVIEGHDHPFSFYFTEIAKSRFFPWIYFLPLSFVALFKSENEKEKNVLQMSFIMSFSFLLLISCSRTKTEWYDAAFYPFASILVGIGVKKTIDYVLTLLKIQAAVPKRIIYMLFFLLVFYFPARKVLSYVNTRPWGATHYSVKYGSFMKVLYLSGFNEPVKFLEPEYNAHLLFYADVYSMKGKNISLIKTSEDIHTGDFVATCSPSLQTEIVNIFETFIYLESDHCICYRISAMKQQAN